MTLTSQSRLAIAAFTIAAAPCVAAAQTQAPTKAAPPSAAAGAPSAPRPTTPPAPLAANPAPIPSDSAVALCMDNTFVKDPGTVTDCAKHGGLRVAMPPHSKTVKRKTTPAFSVNAVAVSQTPAGSTMRCKDGTYLSGTASADRCAKNGGVAAIFSAQAPAPAPPKPQPQKRP
jgi:hypothetical protein